jgi:hypothetical protein
VEERPPTARVGVIPPSHAQNVGMVFNIFQNFQRHMLLRQFLLKGKRRGVALLLRRSRQAASSRTLQGLLPAAQGHRLAHPLHVIERHCSAAKNIGCLCNKACMAEGGKTSLERWKASNVNAAPLSHLCQCGKSGCFGKGQAQSS